MAYTPVEYPAEKGAFYALLKEQLEKYTENEQTKQQFLRMRLRFWASRSRTLTGLAFTW